MKYTLQALQHKSDFLPNEAADPEISLTLPCQLVCALVTALGKQALALLQAGNAQSYVAEVGSLLPRLSMSGTDDIEVLHIRVWCIVLAAVSQY